jgi:hypothetical protein
MQKRNAVDHDAGPAPVGQRRDGDLRWRRPFRARQLEHVRARSVRELRAATAREDGGGVVGEHGRRPVADRIDAALDCL